MNCDFENDMEKPRLRIAACGKKEVLVLDSDLDIQVPATINQYLRDYQREGVKFLYNLYVRDLGGILGDDMGLGKTIQVIALLAALLHKQGNHEDIVRRTPKFIRQLSQSEPITTDPPHRTFLIIAPGSVLYNWLEELTTWGHFVARKYHGSDKNQTLADIRKDKIEVVVTTFDTYRLNASDLDRVQWDAVFVDEVHKIKDLSAATTIALNALPASRRYGLTGTILQNDMAEMWTLFNWARPGCMGSLAAFTRDYIKVIECGQRHSATKRELATARKKMLELREIRNAVVLRRTKQIISHQLPSKEDNVVFCQLSQFQVDVYRAILEHADVKDGVLRMDEKCDCGGGRTRARCCYKLFSREPRVTWSQTMLSYMHLLMKVANHAALLVPERTTATLQRTRAAQICDVAFKHHPQFVAATREAAFRTLSHPKYCGKMKVLQGLLDVFLKRRAKVLLFSYSTRMLDILEQYVISRGYDYRRLDGSVNNKARMDIVKEFNGHSHIFICLISTKAGGLGLNLTGANVVILFDPNWNPSHDLQAQDRAYRIGQQRNVQVYRLISSGTIEENMYLRQIYKQQLDNVSVSGENAKRLFEAIRGDGKRRGELFGVRNMFELRTGDTCLTHDIIQRNKNVEAGLAGYDISAYILPTAGDGECTGGDDSGEGDNDGGCGRSEGGVSGDDGGEGDDGCGSSEGGVSGIPERHEACPSMPSEPSSVARLLEACGVIHTHDNRRVVGSSRAENYMSKCALNDVFDAHTNSQVPAVQCPPSKELGESPSKHRCARSKATPDHNAACMKLVKGHVVLFGQTPAAVKRLQFAALRAHLNLPSLQNLASHITNITSGQRVQLLNDFYETHTPHVGRVYESTGETPRQLRDQHRSDEASKRESGQTDPSVKRELLGNAVSDSDTQPSLLNSECDGGGARVPEMRIGRTDSQKRRVKSPMKCRSRRAPKKSVRVWRGKQTVSNRGEIWSHDPVQCLGDTNNQPRECREVSLTVAESDVSPLRRDGSEHGGNDDVVETSGVRHSAASGVTVWRRCDADTREGGSLHLQSLLDEMGQDEGVPAQCSFTAVDAIFCESKGGNEARRRPAPGASARDKDCMSGVSGGKLRDNECHMRRGKRRYVSAVENLIARGEREFVELFDTGQMVECRPRELAGDTSGSHGAARDGCGVAGAARHGVSPTHDVRDRAASGDVVTQLPKLHGSSSLFS